MFSGFRKNLCDVISVAIGLGVKERALTEWSGLLLWLLWGEGVEVGILFGGIEAGTELTDVGKVAVTADFGFRVTLLQILQEEMKGSLLGWRAGVGILAFLVDASYIADANGMLVVVTDM